MIMDYAMAPKIPDYRSKVGTTLEEICSFAIDIAEQAGASAKLARDTSQIEYTLKAPGQLVTESDKNNESLIIGAIKSRSENDNILAEESANEVNKRLFTDPSWIIDPIDGTTNYSFYLNHVAVSIAYSEGGTVQVGVVHMPFTGETFSAIKGKGAFLNGKKITCPNNVPFSDSLIAFGCPRNVEDAVCFSKVYLEVAKNRLDIRRMASAASDAVYVSTGRIHCYFESVKPWDIAAGALIAKEAGAIVGHYLPLPDNLPVPIDMYSEGVLIAAPNLYPQYMKMVKDSFGVK